ncbi:MAG: hypothetical protein WKG06_18925 [Segetibacter sp.]
MMTLNFTPFPVITTDRLVLRQVNKSDVNEIFILRSDQRVLKFLDRAPAKSTEEAFTFIEKINDLEKIMKLLPGQLLLKKILS